MAKARTQTRDGKTMNLGRLKFSNCAFPQGRFSRTEGTATAQASPPVGMDSRMSFQFRSVNRTTQLKGAAGSPRPQPSTFSLTYRRFQRQCFMLMGVQRYSRMLGLSRV